MTLEVGNLVEIPGDSELGIGKVIIIDAKTISVVFRSNIENRAANVVRKFRSAANSLVLAKDQSDVILDSVRWSDKKGGPEGIPRYSARSAKAKAEKAEK